MGVVGAEGGRGGDPYVNSSDPLITMCLNWSESGGLLHKKDPVVSLVVLLRIRGDDNSINST